MPLQGKKILLVIAGGIAAYKSLDLIRRLISQAGATLTPAGRLVLEIEARQGRAVADLCSAAFPRAAVSILRDLAGLDRVVVMDCGV